MLPGAGSYKYDEVRGVDVEASLRIDDLRTNFLAELEIRHFIQAIKRE